MISKLVNKYNKNQAFQAFVEQAKWSIWMATQILALMFKVITRARLKSEV